MSMLKMVWLLNIFLFCFLDFTGAGQENKIELLNLYDTADSEVLPSVALSSHPLAVYVGGEDLSVVSSSVLKAESWVRKHVLTHYPASKISTIVVAHTQFCQNELKDHNLGMILPSAKNIFHSLTWWGLEGDIKVSTAFSSSCVGANSALFKDDVFVKFTKPLLEFLHGANSTFSVTLPPNSSPSSDETLSLVNAHLQFVTKSVPFNLNKINLIVTKHQKSRKLSALGSNIASPYPIKPNPLLPETSQPPIHSSIGFSAPANIAKNPLPPQQYEASPPPLSSPFASPPAISLPSAPELPPFTYPAPAPYVYSLPPPATSLPSVPELPPFTYPPPAPYAYSPPPPATSLPSVPEMPPFTYPAPAPYAYSLPPCNPGPAHQLAPPPSVMAVQKLWCVAKPSVPTETLQEAMDYACGLGGADCSEIMPQGNCFYPDTVIAHASFAFNKYWQKSKRNGGTCDFGGTAMIINADPSSLQCRFVLN